MTVFAKWIYNGDDGRTVTFDMDGGNVDGNTASVIVTVQSGGTIANLPNPQKANNTFGGWFTERNGGGNVFTTSTQVTSTMTVYAKWTYSGTGGNGGNNTTTYFVYVKGNGSEEYEGEGFYAPGETVSISVTASPEQTFTNWTVNYGGAILENANSASTTFIMPANAVSLMAYFYFTGGGNNTTTYPVTVNGGSGSGSYMAGATVSISAAPSGQTFTNWTVNYGGAILANANSASTTFIMPANAVSVTAHFTGGGQNSGDGTQTQEYEVFYQTYRGSYNSSSTGRTIYEIIEITDNQIIISDSDNDFLTFAVNGEWEKLTSIPDSVATGFNLSHNYTIGYKVTGIITGAKPTGTPTSSPYGSVACPGIYSSDINTTVVYIYLYFTEEDDPEDVWLIRSSFYKDGATGQYNPVVREYQVY